MAVPRDPGTSELYLRLLGDTEGGVRMTLGKPPLFSETITKIRRWIESGAPDWNAFPKLEVFRTRCTLCLYLTCCKKGRQANHDQQNEKLDSRRIIVPVPVAARVSPTHAKHLEEIHR